MATYATISRGSFLHYGDSTREAVKKLNADLDLGLAAAELRRIPVRPTVVNSDRFGIMWHGGGGLDVGGGTIFNTAETTLLDKGQAIQITVDGSRGAKLNPGNGVILQIKDDDDPGPGSLPRNTRGSSAGDVEYGEGLVVVGLRQHTKRRLEVDGDDSCPPALRFLVDLRRDG